MSRASASLALLLVPALTLGCASTSEGDEASATSNLDTSGCSGGSEGFAASGPVAVSASRPPRASCWNVDQSGYTLTYVWSQENDPTPRRTNIGFWTSLNGAGTYKKAMAYACDEANAGGYGHRADGVTTYRCTGTMRVELARYPDLLRAAFEPSGTRRDWEIQVAVSLDDSGAWDSLYGANYRFTFR